MTLVHTVGAGVSDDLLMLRKLRVLAQRDGVPRVPRVPHPAGSAQTPEAGRQLHIVGVGLSRRTGARRDRAHMHPVRAARPRLQHVELPKTALIRGDKRR